MEVKVDYVDMEPGRHMHWLLASFLSLILLGFGSFLCGLYSYNPFAVKGMCSAAYFTFAVISIAFYWAKAAKVRSSCPTFMDSTVFKTYATEEGQIKHKLADGIIVATLGGVATSLGQFSLFLGFYYAPNGRGVITVIVVGSALLSALLSYFIYKEVLKVPHVLGMVICAVGIVIIALQSSTDGTIGGFVCGVLALLFFSLRNLASRQCDVDGLDVVTAGIFNALWEGITGWVIMGFLLGMGYNPFVGENSLHMSYIGGLMIAGGAYFLNQAIMTGYIGPAVTVANLVGVLQICLDFVFVGIVPDLVKIIGSLIAIFGVVFIMMGVDIFNWVLCKKEKIDKEI